MAKTTITSFLLLFLFYSSVFADQLIVNVGGREVMLDDNGSWQYIGNVPLVSKEQVRTNELDINLDKVVIETHETKVQ